MSRLNSLNLLLELDVAGSLTVAATRVGKSISAISKMLTVIEAEVGYTLVDRQARPLRFTDAGNIYLAAARQMRDTLNDSTDRLEGDTEQLRGRLRIACSVMFGNVILADYVHHFHQQHPEVRIEARLSDDYLDLARADVDLAIRHEQRAGGQFIARPLCDNTAWLCASPGYLTQRGRPATPAELDRHAMLVYHYPSLDTRWVLSRGDLQIPLTPKPTLESDSNDFLLNLAIAGDGILACPSWAAATHVATGRLQRCLPEWRLTSESYGDNQLWAVYPASSRGTGKLAQFIDGLRRFIAQQVNQNE